MVTPWGQALCPLPGPSPAAMSGNLYDGIMLREDTLLWKIYVRSQLRLRGKTPFLTGGGLWDTPHPYPSSHLSLT